MLSSFKPQVAPARLNVARASPRVFTDSEWAAATKTATQMLAASESEGEAAVASETGSGVSAVPAPAGRTFSDQDWEKAMKSAPQLLKTLQSIEEGAAAGEAVTRESATSAASSGDFVGKTFTPQQWDAAIKVAVAANQAEEEKVCAVYLLAFHCGADWVHSILGNALDRVHVHESGARELIHK